MVSWLSLCRHTLLCLCSTCICCDGLCTLMVVALRLCSLVNTFRLRSSDAFLCKEKLPSDEMGIIPEEGHSVRPPWASSPNNRDPPPHHHSQHHHPNPSSNLIFPHARLCSNHFTFVSAIDFLACEGKERMSKRSQRRGRDGRGWTSEDAQCQTRVLSP